MKFKKKHKPVTKSVWKILQYLPPVMRKEVIRSKFEINYNLSSDYVFKLAETEDEIEQALNIVYESYSLLGYIDDRPERLHFNAYLCLPTTTILIIKHKDEVVGTLSIVLDSSLGLPSEVTWNLDGIKSKNPRIAEISSLSIKKSHKSSKGHLLLTLCKLMYEYSVKTLQLDGIIIAATLEVEPFYTDLLLFEKVVGTTGQEHKSVKGNKSTCCFLNFPKAKADYEKVYNTKKMDQNLFNFFTIYNSPNISLPSEKISIHGVLHNKNTAMFKVLTKFPNLKEIFSPSDKLKLTNLDPTSNLENVINFNAALSDRVHPRVSIKNLDVFIYHTPSNKVSKACLVDVSSRGFGIKFTSPTENLQIHDECVLFFTTQSQPVSVRTTLKWNSENKSGFIITENSLQDWEKFIRNIFNEINLPLDQKRNVGIKKVS